MTDLLCESSKLDDWMKEVKGGGTPDNFQEESPAKEEAGALTCCAAAKRSRLRIMQMRAANDRSKGVSNTLPDPRHMGTDVHSM